MSISSSLTLSKRCINGHFRNMKCCAVLSQDRFESWHLLFLCVVLLMATESESCVFQTESDSSHPLSQGDHGENSDEAVRKRYGDKEVPFV